MSMQYLSCSDSIFWPMIATGDCVAMVTQGNASAKRVRTIMREQPEVVDDSNALDISRLEGHIKLNGLTFSYLRGTKRVLDGVSVDIPKGSTLAILGKTGTGKTTIANLLLRMYNVKPGMIEIDGNSIEKIPLDTLHKQIAYVPQDNFLFSDSVQSNIAFGVRELREMPEEKDHIKIFTKKSEQLDDIIEESSTEESVADRIYNDLDGVVEAAKLAAIHDNIMDFPKQYATIVGERGVTMSGGQKQRSSIARALMKDSPILILDDALSAVDTDTEEIILENLKKDRADKTTIVIAHRVSTIQNADHILVLSEDGKVAEYGTHDELMAREGIYCRLYEKQQLEKFLELE
ncbi:MAG: ABC transporter ATP-binding protein [Lachnospiraceae bacterium]|nr:ABC transporter ATP-binding protein [Lachnospiraceae bacterium]